MSAQPQAAQAHRSGSQQGTGPPTHTFGDPSIYLFLFPPTFFNLTINLHPQHLRYPLFPGPLPRESLLLPPALTAQRDVVLLPPLSWKKGVQDSHHLQENLWLPVDQRPARWQPLTPLLVAFLFYSHSSAAVKQLAAHPGGCCFPMVVSVAQCYTNKDHFHLRKLLRLRQIFGHGIAFKNCLGSQHWL